ncbi:MAG: hypothetical protein KBT29_02760 [Prevotellaceae bacterium]|nr:hypothetical protein [Candidatus Minthosoma caballi]
MKKILLSLFALCTCLFASADNEYTLGEELTLEQVKAGTPFIIANAEGNVVVYGTNGNMSALQTPTEAGNSDKFYFFKLSAIAGNTEYETALNAARNAAENKFDGEETNDNLYMFHVHRLNGENIVPAYIWPSDQMYISHCGWTSNCNVLNLDQNKFGNDAWYNAIWKVVAEDGGYTLQSQSLGNKNYFTGQGAPSTKAVLKFYRGLVKGDPLPEEDPWTCPEGEIDITTLDWVKNANNCENRLGGKTGDTVLGTDAGPGATPLSYFDLTNYESIKVYGPKGQRARFFINRDEFPSNYQFYADLNEEGVGTLDLATVLASQEGAEYVHLNGIKAAAWGQEIRLDGVTVIEKPAPYKISTTAGKIGTIALDYPATITGATLYEVVSFSDKGLGLAEVEGDMVGGTPYIYQASADEVVCTKTGASVAHGDYDCTKREVGNGLVGCYSEVSPSTGWFGFIRTKYIISNSVLRQISNGNVTIPANRCFFDPDKYTENNAGGSIKMRIAPAEEDATAIKNVNAALEGGKIYDMNGREVKAMQKGNIYVVGGMKVFVK